MSRFEIKHTENYFRHNAYSVVKEIGRGGVSIVYLGSYEYDDGYMEPEYYAIKVFSPDDRFASEDKDRLSTRFKFEQWITYRFRFRKLLSGGFGALSNNIPFIKYNILGDNDLKKLIRSNSILDSSTVFSIISDILLSISFLHANGVIHRDLKPNNIILKNNEAITGDFGISRFVEEKQITETFTKDIMGSRDYIAPEQRENPRGATEKSDIYSLGVIFYELITRRLPTYNYEEISKFNKEYSFLDPIISKMLESNPTNRFNNIIEVADEIFSAYAKYFTKSNANIIPTYPFHSLELAKKKLIKNLQSERFDVKDDFLYNIEDLIVFTKFWLKESHIRQTIIVPPSFKFLENNNPELDITCDMSGKDLIQSMILEIDNLQNKYRFIFDSVSITKNSDSDEELWV
jgi:serine/threonine protein kinase